MGACLPFGALGAEAARLRDALDGERDVNSLASKRKTKRYTSHTRAYSRANAECSEVAKLRVH